MKTIVTNNEKGGDGKSTVTKTLAKHLSQYGKVLLVDSDPQANTTKSFVDNVQEDNKLSNIFKKLPVLPLTVGDNLDLIAASPDLKDIESWLYTKKNREQIFSIWTKKNNLSDYYDYMLVDTHNNTGNITTNMFLAADVILGVSGPSFDSLDGLLSLDSYLTELKDEFVSLETGESLVRANLYYLGNKIAHNTSSSKKFIAAISNYPNYIGYLELREMFNEANNLRTNIFDLSSEKKYQTPSHRDFIKRTKLVCEQIKELIDNK